MPPESNKIALGAEPSTIPKSENDKRLSAASIHLEDYNIENSTPTKSDRTTIWKTPITSVSATTAIRSSDSNFHQSKVLEDQIMLLEERMAKAEKLSESLFNQKKILEEKLQSTRSETPSRPSVIKTHSESDAVSGSIGDKNENSRTHSLDSASKNQFAKLEKEWQEWEQDASHVLSKSNIPPYLLSADVTHFPSKSTLAASGMVSPSKSAIMARKSKQHHQSQQTRNSHSQDLQYAAEIGQSLLAEVRKLQGVVNEKEEALRNSEREKAKMESQSETLRSRIKFIADNEERLKDEIWNLEVIRQDLENKNKKTVDDLAKANASLSRQQTDLNRQIELNDRLQISNNEFKEEITQLQYRYEVDILALKNSRDEIENSSAILQNRVTELEDLYSAKMKDEKKQLDDKNDNLRSTNPTDTESPPVKNNALPQNDQYLEQVISNLHHLQKRLTQSRSALKKEKFEKLELQKVIDELEETTENLSSAASKASKIQKGHSLQKTFGSRNVDFLFKRQRKSKDADSLKNSHPGNSESDKDTEDWSANEFSTAASEADGYETSTDFMSVSENESTLNDNMTGPRSPTPQKSSETENVTENDIDQESVSYDAESDTSTVISQNLDQRDTSTKQHRESVQLSFGTTNFFIEPDKPVSKTETSNFGRSTIMILELEPCGDTNIENPMDFEISEGKSFGTTPKFRQETPVSNHRTPHSRNSSSRRSVKSLRDSVLRASWLKLLNPSSPSERKSPINSPTEAQEESSREETPEFKQSLSKEKRYAHVFYSSIDTERSERSLTSTSTERYDSDQAQFSSRADTSDDDETVKREQNFTEISSHLTKGSPVVDVQELEKFSERTSNDLPSNTARACQTDKSKELDVLVEVGTQVLPNNLSKGIKYTTENKERKGNLLSEKRLAPVREHKKESSVDTFTSAYESDMKDVKQKSRNFGSSNSPERATGPLQTFENGRECQESDGLSVSTVSSAGWETPKQHRMTGRVGISSDFQPKIDFSKVDPLVIQAVTRTMIGEYMYKHVRSGTWGSTPRKHERFVWLHPYTKTVYWGVKNPALANDEPTTKSCIMETVREIEDAKIVEPGLYTKSLLIITKRKSLKLTACSQLQHELWLRALNFVARNISQLNENIGHDQISTVNSSIRDRTNSVGGNASYTVRSIRSANYFAAPSMRTENRRYYDSASMKAPSARRSPAPASYYSVRVSSSTNSRISVAKSMSINQPNIVEQTELKENYDPRLTFRRLSEKLVGAVENSETPAALKTVEGLNLSPESPADAYENVRQCCEGRHNVAKLNSRLRVTSDQYSERTKKEDDIGAVFYRENNKGIDEEDAKQKREFCQDVI